MHGEKQEHTEENQIVESFETLQAVSRITRQGFAFLRVLLLFSVFSVSMALFRQRSFKVDNPKRTSIIVMIQKRTTTWFSFQPFNS